MTEADHESPAAHRDARAAALASLPHGPSFRFVDEVTELEPGRRATGRFRVRGDESILEGHFPGHPLVPGVILIEALAQLAGVVVQTDPDSAPLSDLRLAAVRSAKIRGSAVPGETLEIEARLAGRLGGLAQVAGTVRVGDRLVLEAQLTLSGRD